MQLWDTFRGLYLTVLHGQAPIRHQRAQGLVLPLASLGASSRAWAGDPTWCGIPERPFPDDLFAYPLIPVDGCIGDNIQVNLGPWKRANFLVFAGTLRWSTSDFLHPASKRRMVSASHSETQNK